MKLVSKKYILPFVLIISLFFIWGFARAVLDVLNKHFQDVMSISVTQSGMVQAMTYLGYFLMAIPAGIIITRYGYRRGVVSGLLLFAVGAFLFIPGANAGSFAVFLIALFIIGCGLAILETSANPYVAELGDKETAASRLNFAQSFNGLGCILAPVIVGGFLFSSKDASVVVPYTVMGTVVMIVAVVFMRVKLPEITNDNTSEEAGEKLKFKDAMAYLWSKPQFKAGIIALFFYEIAEISINSLFINYVTSDGWMSKTTASVLLSFGALGLFMIARIVGSWVMSKVSAVKVLQVCGIVTVLAALVVTLNLGGLSKSAVFFCYAFEAIMFPTIFAITIGYAGKAVKTASSLLMMTPIGGAVGTLMMAWISDNANISLAFMIPMIGYTVITVYALRLNKNK